MSEDVRPDVILHVGMPKTGSTAIQRNFKGYDNSDALFPQLAHSRRHADPLIRLFASDADHYFATKRREKGVLHAIPSREQSRLALKSAMRRAEGRKVILSSESLPARLGRPDLIKLRNWMRKHAREVRILAYLRPPVSAASSDLHQSLIKAKMTKLHVQSPRYSLMENFIRVFGEERVELVKYDSGQFSHGNIVHDFADRAGIPLPPKLIGGINRSAKAPHLAMMMALNRQFSDRNPHIVNLAKRSLVRNCEFPGSEKATLDSGLVQRSAEVADLDFAKKHMGEDFLKESQPNMVVSSETDLLEFDPGWHDGIDAAIEEAAKTPDVAALLEEFAAPRRPR